MRAQELECTRELIRHAFAEVIPTGSDREWLAERVQLSSTTPGVPLPPFVFHLSRTAKAVHALPEQLNHWVKFAYLPTSLETWEHEQAVAHAAWPRFIDGINTSRAKTLKALKALAYLAQRDYRARVNGLKVYTVDELAALAGISAGNWYHDWNPRWRKLHAIFQSTDEQALRQVMALSSRRPEVVKKSYDKSTKAPWHQSAKAL